jgi:surface antigen
MSLFARNRAGPARVSVGAFMNPKRLMVIALLGLSVAACSAASGPKQVAGPAPGTDDRPTGTVPGAGGLIGNRIGAVLDDEDRRRASAAQIQALETGPSGAPVPWRNPDSGRYGNVVPGPAYQSNGTSCRQYTQTVFIDGKPQSARGTACRGPDGAWTAAN